MGASRHSEKSCARIGLMDTRLLLLLVESPVGLLDTPSVKTGVLPLLLLLLPFRSLLPERPLPRQSLDDMVDDIVVVVIGGVQLVCSACYFESIAGLFAGDRCLSTGRFADRLVLL